MEEGAIYIGLAGIASTKPDTKPAGLDYVKYAAKNSLFLGCYWRN